MLILLKTSPEYKVQTLPGLHVLGLSLSDFCINLCCASFPGVLLPDFVLRFLGSTARCLQLCVCMCFSDEAHVAATPHIRRPSILSLSAARVSQLPAAPTGAVTPASTSSPTRRTPVGFIPPSASIPLQLRLKKWLAKRGKSLSSYRSVSCLVLHW